MMALDSCSLCFDDRPLGIRLVCPPFIFYYVRYQLFPSVLQLLLGGDVTSSVRHVESRISASFNFNLLHMMTTGQAAGSHNTSALATCRICLEGGNRFETLYEFSQSCLPTSPLCAGYPHPTAFAGSRYIAFACPVWGRIHTAKRGDELWPKRQSRNTEIARDGSAAATEKQYRESPWI